MQLYHGSPKTLNKIEDNGVFEGVFASISRQSALSHHDILHVIELSEKEVLTNYALNYELDYNNVKAALESLINTDNFDRVWEIVIEEKQVKDDDINLFGLDSFADAGDAGWEVQRIRGQVAKKLGYKAVEMDDEHGTSYLVNSNASIKHIK